MYGAQGKHSWYDERCRTHHVHQADHLQTSPASPAERRYVHVPKLSEHGVLVPGSLKLRFDIDLSGGQANNYPVQNVSRAMVSQPVVKLVSTENPEHL